MSPWTLICKGGKLLPKPEEVDERMLLIREALPPDGLAHEEDLVLWSKAMVRLDPVLNTARLTAIDSMPEQVFWQRYFGQVSCAKRTVLLYAWFF
eukprot:SAG11_NODE_116_length_16002_cov_19.164560_23_plen_95_part_00